jgi:hypothetical protein
MAADDSSAYQGYNDPNRPVIGTALTTHIRPGARKPGPKRRRDKRGKNASKSEIEVREQVQRDIQRAHAREDFGRRTAELRQQGKGFAEIATVMGAERGETISHHRVRTAYYKHVSNVEVTERSRNEEVVKLEQAAAKVWQRILEMDDGGADVFDAEVYVKIAETYLKYRERIAKLLGLDAAVKQQITRDGANPGAGLAIDFDSTGLHIRMPGSLEAHAEWERLSELGLTDLAANVIELEEGEHVEVGIDDMMFNEDREKAGLTLRPNGDGGAKAERVAAAIAALEARADPDE